MPELGFAILSQMLCWIFGENHTSNYIQIKLKAVAGSFKLGGLEKLFGS